MPVRQLYEQTLTERGYSSDPAQLRLVSLVAALAQRLLVELADSHEIRS